MAGALDGLTVLDLTTIYSGPLCTSILGDQGANVIKIENTADGDWIRTFLIFQRNGVDGAFAMLNRNKRSLALDLSSEQGVEIFKTMAKTADAVVENYRPGVMEKLGIGYDTLRGSNPGLVFASINGVGHTGPYANRRVYDAIIQAMSGMTTLQSDPRTERPQMINTLICDKITALTAAQSITAALLARQRSGVGQRVDIAMIDAAMFFLWSDAMLNYTFVGDEVPHQDYNTHTNMVRQTGDGYICTMPVQMDEWLGIFRALGLPNLLEDPAYTTEEGLDEDKIQAAINDAFLTFSTEDIAANLDREQVPFSRIHARDDVIHDEQIKAINTLWEFDHPFAGPMRQARPPARFSQTPSEIFQCSPEHGQHTDDILAEFGFDADAIRQLRADKVVA